MSKIVIDHETLIEAIKDFNEWSGAARLYFNVENGAFETSVYHSDLQMTQAYSTENYIAIFSKESVTSHYVIGSKIKEYVIKFAEMLLEGHEAWYVDYHLPYYE